MKPTRGIELALVPLDVGHHATGSGSQEAAFQITEFPAALETTHGWPSADHLENFWLS
jgi:hypothetical protein